MACETYFNGLELESYCKLGVPDEEAYNENTGNYSCRRSAKAIDNALRRLREKEEREIDALLGVH